jgi:hypothetical protein
MPSTECGFADGPGGVLGCDLLINKGPTLDVNFGFDPAYNPTAVNPPPTLPISGLPALVDSGATDSCIDKLLAAQLKLPVVDRQRIAGVHGAREVNMHLAQIHVPALDVTLCGKFAGVDLIAGGMIHHALIGRTFLRHFTMTYSGTTGRVVLSRP